MASKLFINPLETSSLSLFLIIFSLLLSQSLASDVPLGTSVPPETICKSTPHPSVCISVLPHKNANVYDFGRFSVQHSFVQSQKLLDLINKYLQGGSSLSQPEIQALEDCKSLALLNNDFLSNTLETVNKTSDVLPSSDADDVQTLLSAILTNQQTCSDGLQSVSSVQNDLLVSVSNGTNLYSVSLALVTKGWVPKDHKNNGTPNQLKKHLSFRKGRLSLKMSSKARAVYDSVINRRRHLLQAGDEEVVVKDIVVVSQDGSGNFTTITDAINAAPNNSVASDGYFLVYVTAGVYEEYVSIISKKKYLLLIGDGINQTIITGSNSVGGGSTTFNSATLAVVAPGFIAVNITIRNTAGPSMGQAVAVRNGADLSVFYSCSFEGYQDTLYTHSMRQFYRECDIYGTVDFIFGNAAVVFQNCNIYPRQPLKGQSTPITAQGRTDPNQNTGTSIQNCTITASADLASSNFTVKTYLGRPWKEYSRTVYLQNFMDSLIDPAGWLAWSGDFALSTLYYAEYGNRGPGADTSNRVTWPGYHVINANDAENFTVSNFVLGDSWLPQTGVPYTGGLI
ncbi:probable pectinesterase/pectinesterase inhibitor 20 [Rosa rugosa]|uniref:probable pectinesterase/pectinesterase inhibitor 20 n=1 Tax=Rosa rugosa TaxID=74645 RepID=UPI002B40F3C6|nr:probable pectinesterase/pectinesterase inhibitor 20 [Rosa rugosa]